MSTKKPKKPKKPSAKDRRTSEYSKSGMVRKTVGKGKSSNWSTVK